MSQTVIVNEVNVKGYILSVTSRDTEDTTSEMLEELTFRTVGAWLAIADALENNTRAKFVGFGSVEERYADELNKAVVDNDVPKPPVFQFSETFGDARCTVWDTFRGSKSIHFHLNSDDKIPVAIDTWQANQNAIKRILETYHLKPTPDAPQAAPQAPAYNPATDTPAQPRNAQNAPNGNFEYVLMNSRSVIKATRAPNPNEKTYADGAEVGFVINKIVLGTHPNSGSVIYSLWGDLGKKYALKTVYVMASNGTDKSYDYQTAESVLNGLGLTIPGKMQAEGNWHLVCKAANAGERQYLNIISLY